MTASAQVAAGTESRAEDHRPTEEAAAVGGREGRAQARLAALRPGGAS